MKQQLATLVFMIGLVMGFVSCSGNETKSETNENGQNEDLYSMESSSSEILFDDEGDLGQAQSDSSEELVYSESEVVSDESHTAETVDPLFSSPVTSYSEEETQTFNETTTVETDSLDDLSVYRVQDDNETLMMIAFKIYGDYMKWKEIAALNKEMFDHRYVIKKGMMLKFKVPQTEFKWVPQGEPYLIGRGETLSIISNKVYDTYHKWKKIWHNNRPMIRDPDKIFAGFTIYYVPEAVKDGPVPSLAKQNSDSEVNSEVYSETDFEDSSSVTNAELDEQMQDHVSEKTEVAQEIVEESVDENPALRAKKRNPTSL